MHVLSCNKRIPPTVLVIVKSSSSSRAQLEQRFRFSAHRPTGSTTFNFVVDIVVNGIMENREEWVRFPFVSCLCLMQDRYGSHFTCDVQFLKLQL